MKKHSLQEYAEFRNEKFTKRIIFKEEEDTVFVLNFEPGQTLPKHKHPNASVYLLVLQGEGTFTIDGEDTSVIKDDVIVCDGSEDLAFTNNGSSNVSLYVMLSEISNN